MPKPKLVKVRGVKMYLTFIKTWKVIRNIANFYEKLKNKWWFVGMFAIIFIFFMKIFCHPPSKEYHSMENPKSNQTFDEKYFYEKLKNNFKINQFLWKLWK